MNLDELKNAWNEYDKSLDSKVNLDLLKMVSMQKTKSLTLTFKFEVIFEMVVTMPFIYPMVRLVITQWPVWEYWVPGLVLGLSAIGTVAWNVCALIQLWRLHYDASIASTQRKLERIYMQHKWLNTTLLYFLIPLAGVMITIMVFKFLHIELLEHLNILLYIVLVCLIVVLFVVWIVKTFPDKKMESAIRFLDEIRQFEKEG